MIILNVFFYSFDAIAQDSEQANLSIFFSVAGEDELLEKKEFITWSCIHHPKLSIDSLNKLFSTSDRNADGTITKAEFKLNSTIFNHNKPQIMEFQQLPLIWLLTTSLVIISFFGFATHIFLKKMSELDLQN